MNEKLEYERKPTVGKQKAGSCFTNVSFPVVQVREGKNCLSFPVALPSIPSERKAGRNRRDREMGEREPKREERECNKKLEQVEAQLHLAKGSPSHWKKSAQNLVFPSFPLVFIRCQLSLDSSFLSLPSFLASPERYPTNNNTYDIESFTYNQRPSPGHRYHF